MSAADLVTLAVIVAALVALLLLIHFDPANLRGVS